MSTWTFGRPIGGGGAPAPKPPVSPSFRPGYTKSPYVPDAYRDITRFNPKVTLNQVKYAVTPHGRANDTPSGYKPYTTTNTGEKVYTGNGFVAVEAANRKDIIGIGGDDFTLYGSGAPSTNKYNPNYVPVLSRHDPAPLPSWSTTYNVDSAPSWWKGMTYSGDDPNAKYAMTINALIPSLSPEDQRAMATYLYNTFGESHPGAFSAYNPEVANYGDVPKLNEDMQREYSSKNRAQEALTALDEMVKGSKMEEKKFGAGYSYLRSVLGTMRGFGGKDGQGQTREQMVQQLGALSPLLDSAKGDLAPYASVAQALTSPFFSSGSVVPLSKDAKGNYIFGEANKKLY